MLVCVPTPVDEQRRPEPRALRSACADVVRHARVGQTIVLTSTSYVGATRELLTEPLGERGLRVGEDVFVAFAPERIDPGVSEHAQLSTPRVIGAVSQSGFAPKYFVTSRRIVESRAIVRYAQPEHTDWNGVSCRSTG